MGDDIAGVPAAVDDFFQKLIKVLQRDDLQCVVFAAEQILVQRHHVVVGFAFEELEFIIKGFYLFQIHAFAQRLYQFEHDVGGPLQQVDLLGKINSADVLRRDQDAGGEFVNRLGYLVEGVGKILDVLALERRDEGGIDAALISPVICLSFWRE